MNSEKASTPLSKEPTKSNLAGESSTLTTHSTAEHTKEPFEDEIIYALRSMLS
jgi:hypothetical protein